MAKAQLRKAEPQELDLLLSWDRHVCRQELERSIDLGRTYLVLEEGRFVGWMRYNLFWDEHPFLNMLFLLEEARGKGYGRQAMAAWEREMRQLGYGQAFTSTQVDEYAQHFYQRIGYQVVGGFFPAPGDPLELLLRKEL